jgi:DNA-binding XRE family transcriptional regulator
MPGAGLPDLKRKDWVLMPPGKSPVHSDVDRDAMKKAKRKTKSPRTPGTVDEYIGARTREGRCALNMTQESLGELLGVTFQQIQKYESGRNRVNAARLFEICETLSVSLASMFERKLKD